MADVRVGIRIARICGERRVDILERDRASFRRVNSLYDGAEGTYGLEKQ